MSSKKSLSFKTYVQNFLCLFISISVYCLSSQLHCYWFLTHKYLVNSIHYEAFRDVFDFLFTSSLPGTGLFFTAYKHSPLYSKIYIYAPPPFGGWGWPSSQPSHLVEWSLTMSFFGSFLCSMKLLTVWVHITHRIDCGLRMVINCVIVAWVWWDYRSFRLIVAKYLYAFICVPVYHIFVTAVKFCKCSNKKIFQFVTRGI